MPVGPPGTQVVLGIRRDDQPPVDRFSRHALDGARPLVRRTNRSQAPKLRRSLDTLSSAARLFPALCNCDASNGAVLPLPRSWLIWVRRLLLVRAGLATHANNSPSSAAPQRSLGQPFVSHCLDQDRVHDFGAASENWPQLPPVDHFRG